MLEMKSSYRSSPEAVRGWNYDSSTVYIAQNQLSPLSVTGEVAPERKYVASRPQDQNEGHR